MHEAQGELYAVNADVAHIEQQIRHLRENRQRIGQQIAIIRDQLEHRVRQAEDAADSLRRWREELDQAMLAREAGKKKAAVENEKLPDADATFRTCQEKLTETQRRLLLAEQAGRLEESHRDHAGKNLGQLESRRLRLVIERDALSQPGADELSCLQQRAEDAAAVLLQKRETLAQTENLLEGASEEKYQLGREVQALEQQIIKAEARLTALQRLQHRLEGSERLSAWLSKHRLDALPRLWEGIQIEKGWEDALEAVLRERLNSAELERLELSDEWAGDPPPGNARCSSQMDWERKRSNGNQPQKPGRCRNEKRF